MTTGMDMYRVRIEARIWLRAELMADSPADAVDRVWQQIEDGAEPEDFQLMNFDVSDVRVGGTP